LEAGLSEPSISSLIESIQPRGTMRNVLLDFDGLDQDIHGDAQRRARDAGSRLSAGAGYASCILLGSAGSHVEFVGIAA
jgi:hypothetical protein